MNYILEGNINFNSELLKMICEEESEDNNDTEQCLIGGEPLLNSHVTLKCGHKFNYLNIIEEVKRQRIPSILEVQKIKRNQIKCPYCRKIQDGLLPFHASLSAKIYGVNWPPSQMLHRFHCKAMYKYGKKRGQLCRKPSCSKYCNRHKNYKVKKVNKKVNKKVVPKNIIQTINLTSNSNLFTIPSSVSKDIQLCQTILRYGKRKGKKCLCKCRLNNTTCQRHLPKKIINNK